MNLLRNINIGNRLLIAFALIVALMGTLMLAVGISNASNQAEQLAALGRAAEQKALATELSDALLSSAVAIRNIGLQTTVDKVQQEEDEANKQRTRFLKAMSQLDKSNLGPEETQVFEKLTAIDKEMSGRLKEAINFATMFNPELSAAVIINTIDPLLNKARGELIVFVQLQEKSERKALEVTAHRQSTAKQLAIGATIIVILLAAGVALLITRSIVNPLRAAVKAAEYVAQGDLSHPLVADGNDEVSQLLVALRQMQKNLSELINQITQTAEQVQESAGSMSATSDFFNQSMQSQSEAVSSAAAAIEETTVSIQMVSETAKAAHNGAEYSARIANEGKQRVDSAVVEVKKIAESVGASTQIIGELHASSQQISQIANVIRDIADQTNLLALNAAIEAARAGEHGRGFAVVADEVRKLAERTSTSTSEIKQMIDSIQAEADRAVEQMKHATHYVESGVGMINDLQAPLQNLADNSSAAAANLADLSGSIGEQSMASTQISQSIEKIAQMGEENSRAAAESYKKAKKLKNTADSLQATVGRFHC